ncbi:MAG: glucose-6-phosphate isomerase, partial [Halobacteriota archaeon]
MNVELGNALAPTAIPGVSRDSLERLDGAVARAHDRIERGVDGGQPGYRALALGDEVDPASIVSPIEALPEGGPVIVVGMGGSALGARAMAAALAPDREWYVLDTIDPTYLRRLLAKIEFEDAVCHVVSMSGHTVETRVTFELVREAMDDAGVDWRERTVATTAADSPLGERIAAADIHRYE